MLNQTNSLSKQPTGLTRIVDDDYLTDETGQFIADDLIMKQRDSKQKKMFIDALQEFRGTVPQSQPVNNEDNEELKRQVADLKRQLEEYKTKQPDIDRVIIELNAKEQEQARFVDPICRRYLLLDPTGQIENHILNPLISLILAEKGRTIKTRNVPGLLKKLFGITYTQAGSKTFYPGIGFNPQTYHEIEPYVQQITNDRANKQKSAIVLPQLQSNSPRSPIMGGATSPAPIMMNRQ